MLPPRPVDFIIWFRLGRLRTMCKKLSVSETNAQVLSQTLTYTYAHTHTLRIPCICYQTHQCQNRKGERKSMDVIGFDATVSFCDIAPFCLPGWLAGCLALTETAWLMMRTKSVTKGVAISPASVSHCFTKAVTIVIQSRPRRSLS